jgi:membrane-associated protease RseP (regulator of RpoE activity)
MSKYQFRGAVEWALMVGLIFGAGAVAQAQNDEAQDDSRVIQIGPADANEPAITPEGGVDANVLPEQETPKYWIGLLGGPVTPDLRHHVEIPENEGVLIREIVPDSPAAKAGLEQFDIVLRANDTVLHDMRDMVELVRTEGEKKAQITLEVLRHGERETVYVTPEERPAHVARQGSTGGGFGGGPGLEGFPEELQKFFGEGGFGDGGQLNFRQFGPGVIVGRGGAGIANMPNGVSISIHKENDQPARITVKRGDQSWEVVGDDAESLKQLPEDLRPFVEQMLRGGAGGFNVELPELGNRPGFNFNGERLQQRLEEMERRLEEMQRRFQDRGAETDEQAEIDAN